MLRYVFADLLREMASEMLRSSKSDPRKVEPILVRAVAKYQTVLLATDSADEQEGTSLHAAALRRIVQVETSLYDWYERLAQEQPRSESNRAKASKHRKEAEDAFERLKLAHPEARLPNGIMFVDQARQDAEKLTR